MDPALRYSPVLSGVCRGPGKQARSRKLEGNKAELGTENRDFTVLKDLTDLKNLKENTERKHIYIHRKKLTT